MDRGYIALWRKVQDHEFWQEKRVFSKYEAWSDMLMEARHSLDAHNVMLGMQAVECGYGQCIKSVRTWARRWRWSESKVRRFFKLCEDLGQIDTEAVGQTTRLTICNYALYDPKRRASGASDEKTVTHSRRTPDALPATNNNDKNGNHGKKKIALVFPEALRTEAFKEAWQRWEKHWKEKKRPVTHSTADAQIKKLTKLGSDEAIRWIDRAIEMGWTGLYEPAGDKAVQVETDPGMLDYARQYIQLVKTQPGDDFFESLFMKARDNYGSDGVQRMKEAARQLKEAR